MLARLKRTAISFVVVIAAFLGYRLVVEPIIDPARELKKIATNPGVDDRAPIDNNRLGPYLRFFPEGAWERGAPMVIETDTAKFVFGKYEIGGEMGRKSMKLEPCTLILLPEGEADPHRSDKRVVLMRTERAILHFAEEIDLSTGQLGRLVGGDIPGEVVIHSAATRSDGSDDLVVFARDLKMTDKEIYSDHEVQFRFGPSHGSGREMRIALLPAEAGTTDSLAPNIGGIQDFKLMREVRMHLQPGDAGLMPGDEQAAQQASTRDKPVDIRCNGPFTFDLVANVAEFREEVVVLRQNDIGPADQMVANLLSIYFAERESKEKQSTKKKPAERGMSSLPRLTPKRFEARGFPVEVRAPSSGVYAVGNRMEYEIGSGRITLQSAPDAKPVYLNVREVNEAEARSLQYEPAVKGALIPKLYSKGPGWLRAQPTEGETEELRARWTNNLSLRPHEGSHVLSVVGDALVEYTGQGRLDASEIHLWLGELSADAALAASPAGGNLSDQLRGRVRPERLLADGGVAIDSPRLSGEVGKLMTWFRSLGPSDRAAAPRNASAQPRQRDSNRDAPREPLMPPRDDAQQHYTVRCRELKTGILIDGTHSQIEFAELTDNVEFNETPAKAGDPSPLAIRGDSLRLEDANTAARVTVLGQPAQVLAQGMTMQGSSVRLDRAQTRLWIDGPGKVHLAARPKADPATAAPADGGAWQTVGGAPAPNADTISPLAGGGPLDITWQEGMNFDGRTIEFRRGVVAEQASADAVQTIRNELMTVTLRSAVDFSDTQRREQPEVEWVTVPGRVFLENKSFDKGQPVAVDRMDLANARVNQLSGELISRGRGIAKSWRYGPPPQSQFGAIGGRNAAKPADPQTDEPDKNQITYSQIEYQAGLTGNILEHQRQITFHEGVRGIFGPVADWQTELYDETMQPSKVVLHADRLMASQAPRNADGEMPLLVEAQDNVHLESMSDEAAMVTAMAPKMTYDQAKDWLVIRGDARNLARIYQQERVGAQQQGYSGPVFEGSPRRGVFKGQITSSTGSAMGPISPQAAAAAPGPTR